MLGLQGNNPNNNGYVATTYFEYHGVEPGAYYGLEYRRVSSRKRDLFFCCWNWSMPGNSLLIINLSQFSTFSAGFDSWVMKICLYTCLKRKWMLKQKKSWLLTILWTTIGSFWRFKFVFSSLVVSFLLQNSDWIAYCLPFYIQYWNFKVHFSFVRETIKLMTICVGFCELKTNEQA